MYKDLAEQSMAHPFFQYNTMIMNNSKTYESNLQSLNTSEFL